MYNKRSFIADFNKEIFKEEYITGSASKRQYSRLFFDDYSVILCESEQTLESQDFVFITQELAKLNIRVPKILRVSKNLKFYLLEDLGNTTLLSYRTKHTGTLNYYKKALSNLIKIQQGLNKPSIFNKLNGYKHFDIALIYRDLFYFKHYFLDLIEPQYHEVKLLNEFRILVNNVSNIIHKGFMYRDFQGRNIMLDNHELAYIDYQGGMQGPVVYDLISLIWQAKAKLSEEEKEILKQYYLNKWNATDYNLYKKKQFESDYQDCLILRLLQVLGAYGRLGILKNKKHFKESISYGLQNLLAVSHQPDFRFQEIQHIANALKLKYESNS